MARKKGRSVSDVSRYTGGASSRPPSFGDQPEDDTVTSGTVFGLIAVVVALAIIFGAVRFGTGNIESDLVGRSTQALRVASFPAVDVQAAGTVVSLSGSYTSDQSEEAAFSAVAAVAGVSDVEGQIWLVSTDEMDAGLHFGDVLEISWLDGTATISGEVSTEEKRELVATTVEATFDDVDADELLVVEGLEDESEWLGSVLALVQAVGPELPEGLVRADGLNHNLVVSGDVLEKSIRDRLNENIAAAAVTIGFITTPAVRLLDTGPTEAEVEELQENLNDLVLDQVVEFEVKSFALTEKGMELLDDVLNALSISNDIQVRITGHTDDRGSTQENQLLSQERALAVLAYLVEHGQPLDRFEVAWFGESQPTTTNDTAEGRARNRRIEFTALLEDDE